MTTPSRRTPPRKPAELSADAEALWDFIVEQSAAGNILKPLDAAGLEIACETYARWRDATRKRRQHGALSKNSQGVVTAPWVGIEERAAAAFKAWAAEYGLTPLSRGDIDGIDAGVEAHGTTLDQLRAKREERRRNTA